MDTFFPKCFTLTKIQGDLSASNHNELEEFNEEYRFIYSASILKKYVKNATSDISTYAYRIPKILVALNICEKQLLTIDEQINQFGECNAELCSQTEWKILEISKKNMTPEKLKEINEKRWYAILASQYMGLLTAKDKIKNPK